MIEIEAVWRLIDEFSHPLPLAEVPLEASLNLTLAEDAKADADHPPFDRSAMDGYAIGATDSSEEFTIIETIRAGDSKSFGLQPGQAARIFTGAELPGENLKVVMQENCSIQDGQMRLIKSSEETFIRKNGEDFRKGEVLIPAGTVIDAVGASLLASIGNCRPKVFRNPAILHFSCGDELVPPDQVPNRGQIRDTNSTLMRGFLGGGVTQVHLPDHFEKAMALIHAADPESFDMILFSGGASVGDHDFAKRFLATLGFSIHCDSVDVRPGKPLIFASQKSQIAFGIPGNPVAHFVCYHLFIARALARLAARKPCGLTQMKLATFLPGKPNPRVTFWPGVRAGDEVAPLPWNSSGHLASLCRVNALIRVESNAVPAPGEVAEVLLV